MKKFFRNLFSGYLFIILFLLVEVGVLLTIQFGADDLIVKIFGLEGDATLLKLIVALVYLAIRGIGFIIAFIIFFKINFNDLIER